MKICKKQQALYLIEAKEMIQQNKSKMIIDIGTDVSEGVLCKVK
ncbi:hypothetical protein [Bacillus toyonensis]|nr:hypothetical protein [Bacillus toyonensis]